MVDQNLVNYINQLLQSGYDASTVRNQLLSAGYNPAVVNEAMSYAAPSAASGGGINALFHGKKFLFLIGGIIGVIVIALILILLLSGEEVLPISLQLSADVFEANAGDDFDFAQYVTDLGETGQVSMSYTVFDDAGSVLTTDSASYDSSLFSPFHSISIPSSASSGEYTLMAKASYKGETSESMMDFTVGGAEEEVTEEEFEEELPEEEEFFGEGEEEFPEEQPPSPPAGAPGEGSTLDPEGDEDHDGVLNLYDFYKGDRDNDGVLDRFDTDNDNDGTPDDEDLYPYDYDNDGIDDRDDNSAGRSYDIPTEQGASAICKNNYDCNDFDICTNDICSDGECSHAPTPTCCGDGACDGSETESSCPADCKEEAMAGSAVDPANQPLIDQAVQTAPTNKDKAIKTCTEISLSADKDTCMHEVAKASDTPSLCAQIDDEQKRNTCYMFFAMNTGDFTVCKLITDRYLRNSCYAMETVTSQLPTCTTVMDCEDTNECTTDTCNNGRCYFDTIPDCYA